MHPLVFSAVHFLMFNLGDFAGRTLCSFPRLHVWAARRLLLLALLRTLFAPWRCARGLARLVGGVWGSGRYVGAVDAGAGEELCWLAGRVEKYAENHLLAGIGL